MSSISGASLRVTAASTSTPARDKVTGVRVIGGAFNFAFPDARMAWGAAVEFYGAALDAIADLGVGTVTSAEASPVAQVETATAAGTITTAGNATVTVTSALVTGSPLAISVAVALDDTATLWAAKCRTALAANAAIAAHYTVGGAGTAIVLTAIVPAADIALNIALADDTSAGITEAATSADTTAGVAGVTLTGGEGEDDEGNDTLDLLILRNTGASYVTLTGAMIGGSDPAGLILADGQMLILTGNVDSAWWENALTITSGGRTTLEVLVYATPAA